VKTKPPKPLQQNTTHSILNTFDPPLFFASRLGCSSRMAEILLRWFGAEEMLLNCVCSPEQKACPFEVLVSFLNQGHLFLSGKREMFLKARLSIKSIGCHGYHLPHRTALCVQLCDFLYSQVHQSYPRYPINTVGYIVLYYNRLTVLFTQIIHKNKWTQKINF